MATIGVLKLEKVRGSEHTEGIGVGRATRVAQFINQGLPAGILGDKFALVKSLKSIGLPQKGSSLDPGDTMGYKDWYLKNYIVSPMSARLYIIQMIYEWKGLKLVHDSTSQYSSTEQMHPNGTPLYATFLSGTGVLSPKFTKVINAQFRRPLRHLTYTKTIDFQASENVINAFGCVNSILWQGFPIGCWQLTDLDGETTDEGITYTYSATWTTRANKNQILGVNNGPNAVLLDWSEYFPFIDNQRQALKLSAADLKAYQALRKKPYAYGVDNSVNGITKVGFYPVVDFFNIFGI